MDIDGRLETITSASPSQIECGDWVVVAGRADHEAALFYNESRPAGNRRRRYQTTGWTLAALGALAVLVGESWSALHSPGHPTAVAISYSLGGPLHSSCRSAHVVD